MQKISDVNRLSSSSRDCCGHRDCRPAVIINVFERWLRLVWLTVNVMTRLVERRLRAWLRSVILWTLARWYGLKRRSNLSFRLTMIDRQPLDDTALDHGEPSRPQYRHTSHVYRRRS